MFRASHSGTSFSSASLDREEPQAHARGLLLGLAAELECLGLRARVVEEVLRPVTLRVWEPQRQSSSAEVVASQRVEGGFVFVLMSDGAMGLPAAIVPADVPTVAARELADRLQAHNKASQPLRRRNQPTRETASGPMGHPARSGSITPARKTEEA
ncbi:hypothetical protein GCM10022254_74820 [Actinomadura meridiana]|uniref:Uncharacterized protein n=1 Tax=Actinomadura meridiana TaxID=559626 RepID=A0ABP8CR99_9ACTN